MVPADPVYYVVAIVVSFRPVSELTYLHVFFHLIDTCMHEYFMLTLDVQIVTLTLYDSQGLSYNAKKNILYVADTENHALRYFFFFPFTQYLEYLRLLASVY